MVILVTEVIDKGTAHLYVVQNLEAINGRTHFVKLQLETIEGSLKEVKFKVFLKKKMKGTAILSIFYDCKITKVFGSCKL
jgi:hypothetical protein